MPFNTIKLQHLIAQIRKGDKNSQDALIRASLNRLEQLARRMLRNFSSVQKWEDTCDVLQQSLIRLLRAIEVVTPGTTRDFFNLAAEQIRRQLIDLARRYQGPQGLGKNVVPLPMGQDGNSKNGEAEPADATNPQDDLKKWSDLHQAVESLPALEREVFSLAFYHGWTQAQIAELFQVDKRTIRRKWQKACLLLREKLSDSLPEV